MEGKGWWKGRKGNENIFFKLKHRRCYRLPVVATTFFTPDNLES